MKYFSQVSVEQYLDSTSKKFPFLYQILEKEQFTTEKIKWLLSQINSFDFEENPNGGRGGDYLNEQSKHPLNRYVGFRQLFDLIIGDARKDEELIVLDAMGGNGTLYKASELLGYNHLKIIISDISSAMIESAFNQNIPCVRQPAQNLLLKDNSVDAVVFAYGTHHIPAEERYTSFKEAYRVLKEGGKLLIHDYEEGSKTSEWYSDVLDKYTYTGHKYIHFTKLELNTTLSEIGYSKINVANIYDPFIIEGDSQEEARENMLNHLVNLFGMRKLKEEKFTRQEDFYERVEGLVNQCFDFTKEEQEKEIEDILTVKKTTVYPKNIGKYIAEVPRIALIGVGEKAKSKVTEPI